MAARWFVWAVLMFLVACGGGGVSGNVSGLDREVGADVAEEGEVGEIEVGGGEVAGEGLFDGFEVDGGDGGFEVVGSGMFGWPCKDNVECYSGFCILTPEGRTCTSRCDSEESCPKGFVCAQVATQPDVIYACVHPAPKVCEPCKETKDCEAGYVATAMECALVGGRYYCLARCGGGQECPAGTECVDLGGRGGGKVCVPEGGECECKPLWTDAGVKGACVLENQYGKCLGEFECTAQGVSECLGRYASKEVCNGLDDDCNGQTDDVGDMGPCPLTNAYGTCEGKRVCVGGVEVCQGQYAQPEACNGLDEDCDGETDEGFSDIDGDGKADCVDEDDDGDGVADLMDNCPTVANPDQSDFDKDGIGDACDGDKDGDGDPDNLDCAPLDPSVHHNAVEACNGRDDDCDGEVDEEGSIGCVTFYYDEDGDGYGSPLAKCLCGASGAYQASVSGDCNDLDPFVSPGGVEVCGNGQDDNCNGSENDVGAVGCVEFYEDKDGDGYGVGEGRCQCYAEGVMSAKNGGDCDDGDAFKSPGREEKCNDGKDNDCDGEVDEAGCQGCTNYYRDEDQDGYGVSGDKKCLGQAEYPYTAPVGLDCDDSDPSVRPGVMEVCNGKDDNCDGTTDPAGSLGCQNLYPDADGDGYGGVNQTAICYCGPTGIYTATVSGDCLDSDPKTYPSAEEVCDGKDNNCNGQVDEGLLQTYFKDADGDGYGVAGDSKALCGPQGYYTATQSGDCDDKDPERYPGNVETCDGKDNNCNGQVDEGLLQTYFKDADGDGYGLAGDSKSLCGPEAPYTALVSGDCDDADPERYPGNVETCDTKDNNCNGQVDEGLLQTYFKDADGDGYGLAGDSKSLCGPQAPYTALVSGDCDDSDPERYPGNVETCDGKDNNCNGQIDEGLLQTFFKDADGDGYGLTGDSKALCSPQGYYTATQSGDCDDSDPERYPGNVETCDGKDNNCNGQVDEGVQKTFFRDFDGDGYGGIMTAQGCTPPAGYVEIPGDCNDYNPNINPGAKETCNDIDDDCDGEIDEGLPTTKIYKDNDGDGFAAANATSQDKCNIPVGWATAKDVNGDGKPDWDCDDTDVTSYPYAPELCDGRDNDCSGNADEPCPTLCSENWPITTGSYVNVLLFDLDRDGFKEIYYSSVGGIRSVDGTLLTNTLPDVHWNDRTFADIDGDFVPEVVQSNGIYKRGSDWTFTKFWDLSIANPGVADVNNDARLDVFGEVYEDDGTGAGCRPVVLFVRSLSPFSAELVKLPYPAEPQGRSHCAIAPAVADLDSDGVMEILFGQSHSQSPASGRPLDGRLYVYKCTDAPTCKQWTVTAWSDGHDQCGAWWDQHIWVGDYVGDGSHAVYFWNGCASPVFNVQGKVIGNLYVAFTGLADVDGNGRFDEGTCTTNADVDGDGMIDCIGAGGIKSGRTKGWFPGYPLPHDADWIVADDLDNDGRLEIITTSTSNKSYCYRLGKGSYNERSLLVQWYAGVTPLSRNGMADNLEPNDTITWDSLGNITFKNATRYPFGANAPYPLRAFISRPGDVDWFEVAGSYANASLRVPSGKDYDLEIYCENKNKGEGQPGLIKLAESKKTGSVDEWANAGYLPYNDFAKSNCVSLSRYFVKVFGKTSSDFGTRPYLLRANLY